LKPLQGTAVLAGRRFENRRKLITNVITVVQMPGAIAVTFLEEAIAKCTV
jgi:hypothetical protein